MVKKSAPAQGVGFLLLAKNVFAVVTAWATFKASKFAMTQIRDARAVEPANELTPVLRTIALP
jgi:Zn-dependent membrane protease YugP